LSKQPPAALNRALFEKSFLKKFQKSFAMLFEWFYGNKFHWLNGLSYLVLYRQMLPGRRSLGRPLHGRIVVRERTHHYT
jgi:hypothetical protein